MATGPEGIVSKLLELERELEKARRYREKWATRCVELERDIEAFQRVARQLEIDVDSAKEEARTSTGHVTRLIRETAREIEEPEFTVHDVKARRQELAAVPTSSVSRVLIRMQEEGELELVERGSGNRASRYRQPQEISDDAAETKQEGGDVTPFRKVEGGG